MEGQRRRAALNESRGQKHRFSLLLWTLRGQLDMKHWKTVVDIYNNTDPTCS